MNLDRHLLDLIVCPACRQSLAVDEAAEELVCAGCGCAYPVRDDIPVLLVDEARKPVLSHDLRRRSPRRRDGAGSGRRTPALPGRGRCPGTPGGGRGRRGRCSRRCSGSPTSQPRAVVAAGPDSRLLRAVLEPVCPVPFVAWPGPGLPGWAGSLDLVVVLAPEGDDRHGGRRRRGRTTRLPAGRGHARAARWSASTPQGRYTTLLPTQTGDQLAIAVVVLDLLDRVHLGPQTDPDVVADALDEVAVSCSPHQDLAVNPAKILAIGIADSNPLLWGGTVLAARAARRIAESIRRATGRTALAADAEHLLPVLEATAPADVFADPFADGGAERRPALVVLDDGTGDPTVARDPRPARAGRPRPRRTRRVDLLRGRRRRGALRRDALDRHLRGGVPPARDSDSR